jgi:hypothetical protein
MMLFDRGIDAFGNAFAGQPAGHSTRDNADGRADRPGDCASGGTCRGTPDGRSNPRAYRVCAMFAGNRIGVLIAIEVFVDICSAFIFARCTVRCHNKHSNPSRGKKSHCRQSSLWRSWMVRKRHA